MNTEKLLARYKSTYELECFQNKLITRFQKQNLVFGNAITCKFKNIIHTIESILQDVEHYQECEFCNNKIFSGDLIQCEGYSLCDTCYNEQYTLCTECGCDVYTGDNDYHVLYECDVYCNKCYFNELDVIYSKHTIKNKLLKKLQEKLVNVTYKKLVNAEFKIDNNLWNIEKHSSFFRFGSWGANGWVDIGTKQKNLLYAIDYHLNDNSELKYINNI